MNVKVMLLDSICERIVDIEEGLMYGTISFSYDSMMSAMKPGHPMEILDSIQAEIFFDVKAGVVPELSHVKNVLDGLIAFKKTFKVKELTPVIKDLKDYIEFAESTDGLS